MYALLGARPVPDPPPAGAGLQKLACLAALVLYSFAWPDEACAAITTTAICRSSPPLRRHCCIRLPFLRFHGVGRGRQGSPETCRVWFRPSGGSGRNIIKVIHASRVRHPSGPAEGISAGRLWHHSNSFDGRSAPSSREHGGPAGYTEYNVLLGLSSRSFGRFAYFVTRIARAGFERRTAARCAAAAYSTLSLLPPLRLIERAHFRPTTGIQHFYDAHRSRRQGPSSPTASSRQGLQLYRTARHTPRFTSSILAANHLPWETLFRPDLIRFWQPARQRAVGR